MKSTTFGILTVATIAASLLGGSIVSADIVDKQDNGDITVNGSLGADNTDPDATIPDGDTTWIKVSLPTTTVFYNTAADKDIKSGTYTITNLSGRPVGIGVASFTQTNTAEVPTASLPDDYNLTWNVAKLGTPVNLVTGNQIQSFDGSQLFTLGATSTPGGDGESTTFTYGGSATAASQLQPSYTLKVSLKALPAQ